jgi:hypothetical protein
MWRTYVAACVTVSADFARTRTKVFLLNIKLWNLKPELTIPRGLTVRIAGFHPAGPGSTSGVGKFCLASSGGSHYRIVSVEWLSEAKSRSPWQGDKVDSGIGLPMGKCVGVDIGMDIRWGYILYSHLRHKVPHTMFFFGCGPWDTVDADHFKRDNIECRLGKP